MPYEPILFRCDDCGARIVVRGDHVVLSPRPSERKNASDEREVQSSVHEGHCPKCDAPFEIWSQPTISSTHTLDLEVNRPEIFVGDATARVAKLADERAAEMVRREESRIASEERKRRNEFKRLEAEEAGRIAAEEQRKARLAARSTDDGDEGDWDDDDGGRTPNDDRSDSMNPNNDAYYASRR